MNHQIQMNDPSFSIHHHLPHPHPRCHLPRSRQLALVQVGAPGVQDRAIATIHQLPAMSEW